MMWGDSWGMGWWWILGFLLLVGVAFVVVIVVVLVQAYGRGSSHDSQTPMHQPPQGHARHILDERYARGELTTEQYREQIRVLGESR